MEGNLLQAIPELARQRDAAAAAGYAHLFAAVDDVPPFCRLVVHTSFSTDSSVESEVWLPLTGWNGRFLGLGNGVFADDGGGGGGARHHTSGSAGGRRRVNHTGRSRRGGDRCPWVALRRA